MRLSDADLEKAAREYCRLLNIRPDDMVEDPNSFNSSMWTVEWKLAAREVRKAHALQRALELVPHKTGV